MNARTAWTMARIARHPDELIYAVGHWDGKNTSAASDTADPGKA